MGGYLGGIEAKRILLTLVVPEVVPYRNCVTDMISLTSGFKPVRLTSDHHVGHGNASRVRQRMLPVREQRANAGHQGQWLVEHDGVSCVGYLDYRRHPAQPVVHQLSHVG
jgi:hypothetical protein